MAGRRPFPLLVVALVVVLLSCGAPRTAVIVHVDTDMNWGPSGPVRSLRLLVYSGEGNARTRRFETLALLGTGRSEVAMPVRLAVLPLNNDATRVVTVEAWACTDTLCEAGGDILVLQRAIFGFIEGETRELPLLLASVCRSVRCPPMGQTDDLLQTCRPDLRGMCGSAREDVTTFPMSARDAGRDGAQVDATNDDASPDVNGTDAAPEAGVDAAAPDAVVPDVARPDVAVDVAPDARLDAGVDAPPDARMDAGVDVAPDVPPDARVDAGVDALPDAAPDARMDAGVDAPPDVAPDVRVDVGVDAAPDVRVDAAVDVAPDVAPDVPAPPDVAPDVPPDRPPMVCGGSTCGARYNCCVPLTGACGCSLLGVCMAIVCP